MEDPVDQVLVQLEALIPRCDKGMKGPCLELPDDQGRGFAVYHMGEQVCMSPILLPGFNLLPRWLLGGVYLIFLLWLFGGVSIAADLFMEGIMRITATTKKVRRKNERGEIVVVEEPVWNWVVANITLMALGTSAPEIMLSLVEALLTLGKTPGELGPSCIVGSAAYNYLVISAVCTLALPAGTFKRITQLRVYVTTCVWSMWAYIWMLVVYRWWTPDEVTLAEALLTLAFFVLLVASAWLVDTQPWRAKGPRGSGSSSSSSSKVAPLGSGSLAGPPTGDLELGASKTAWQQAGGKSDGNDGAVDADDPNIRTASFFRHIMAQRMRNRRNRLRSLFEAAHDTHATEARASEGGAGEAGAGAVAVVASSSQQQVMFRSPAYSFLESAGVARVAVMRLPAAGGDLSRPLVVHFRTEDGDAVAGLDYKAAEGRLILGAGEASKYIEVTIIDDDQSEPDVSFSIVLLGAELMPPAAGHGGGRQQFPGEGGGGEEGVAVVQPRVRVTIVDDDDAGLLGFELPEYEVGYNDTALWAEVAVVRRKGADGRVEVQYDTLDESALAGKDYEAASGTLVFESGQKSAKVRIRLLAHGAPEAHKALRVALSSPQGGAELSSRHTTRITIVRRQLTRVRADVVLSQDPKGKTLSREGSQGADDRTGSSRPGYDLWGAWAAQIKDAFDSTPAEEGQRRPWAPLILHYINFTPNILLSIMVPPPDWKGGYPCFLVALASIIGLVYLINEAGVLFGCMVGLKDIMTGISIVAMGTSLPDTLASRISALNDADADNAIGNITGSNSVNVFLGLGLPWLICSVYYTAKGERYITPAGDLSFAVMLYAIVGSLGIAILALCRRYGGELGGSKRRQYLVAGLLGGLWLLYLILSGLRAYGQIGGI